MTARHPLDCYLTPPCVALAINGWLWANDPTALLEPWLDPFSGAGRLLYWATGGARSRMHAMDIDTRWRDDLAEVVLPARTRLGGDSLVLPWTAAGGRPAHVVTNHPYGRDEAVQRLHDHARTHGRWALGVLRTDWWQHPGRWDALRPDVQLQLGWRPAFGMRLDAKTGRVALGTDRYTGYTVSVWRPVRAARCELEVLARPEVPKSLKDEHKRLARRAYALAHEAAA